MEVVILGRAVSLAAAVAMQRAEARALHAEAVRVEAEAMRLAGESWRLRRESEDIDKIANAFALAAQREERDRLQGVGHE